MENSTLRTAYMLQVHKNPDQINKFIQQLISDKQADVYIHIDEKSKDKLIGKIIKSPNVKILDKSINCEWGDISQVDATIMLLRAVIESKQHYDFVCLRSGQDLLIKDGFKDFLIAHKKKVFMTCRVMEKENWGFLMIKWPKITRKRYTTTHPIRIYRRALLSLYGKGINLSPALNQWPKDYSFFKGSQWFTIPYDVAKYMVEFLTENEWYYRFFEDSLVPDEVFFNTLIMNSPYQDDVVNNNLMFFKWGETLSERNSPQDLTIRDISLIEESNQYFARKFDENVDKSVVEYFFNKVRFEKCKTVKL